MAYSKFEIYKIAGEAEADPRTVQAYLEGRRSPMPAIKRAVDNAINKLRLRRAPRVQP